MAEAFRLTRRDGACGIDEQTGKEYAEHFFPRVRDLLNRVKGGKYFAPPVKRGYIPKGDGKEMRPLGIPTFEDKLLQRAVKMLLEPIYEQDFLDCSFGFRPGRSAHQALQSIWRGVMSMGGCWILDVDIRKYFDTIDHRHLREFLSKRVRDGVIRRLVHKWLKAGVWEAGQVSFSDQGTPQGGVISPLLSNIYLHEVLDTWFEEEIKPLLSGNAFLVRYADDFVIGFARREDAERVLQVLPKRFGKFGLAIHPDKTRLVYFAPPSRGGGDPETFDFLGFTHYWGESRKGGWIVKRKTASSRLNRGLKNVAEFCRKKRHTPVGEQQASLARKLQGHYNYYGIIGNIHSLRKFHRAVERLWRKWLDRRDRKRGTMTWDRFHKLIKCYKLPLPRIVHGDT